MSVVIPRAALSGVYSIQEEIVESIAVDRWLIWFLTGLVFLGVDLALPHLVLLFFGIGAIAAAFFSFAGSGLQLELVAFLVFSLVSLLLLRRKLAKIFSGGKTGRKDEEISHPLIGHIGTVSRDIVPGGIGEVSIDGSFWRARASQEIRAGTTVCVMGVSEQDALTLLVTPHVG